MGKPFGDPRDLRVFEPSQVIREFKANARQKPCRPRAPQAERNQRLFRACAKNTRLWPEGGLAVKLSEAQSRELLAKHGVYVTEACDKCGQILGPVRFTRDDQPGESCSRECRDGVQAAARYRVTRKGGRPPKYRTDGERQTAERQQHAIRQQAYRKRRRVTENPLVSGSFHASTEGESRPLAIPLHGCLPEGRGVENSSMPRQCSNPRKHWRKARSVIER